MTNGNIALAREIADDRVQDEAEALGQMNVAALRKRYREVFKEDSRSNNAPYLRKRIQYRLQELAYGGLSERAKARIRELVVDTPFRRRGFPVLQKASGPTAAAPSPVAASAAVPKRDPRLPPPGTTLRREYGKALHVVVVEADGFVFRGERFGTLSKIARAITATSWNGFTFFGLTTPWEAR
jgi:hypothetical protein